MTREQEIRRTQDWTAPLDHASGTHNTGYSTREPYHVLLAKMAKQRHKSRLGHAGATKAAQKRAKSRARNARR